MARSCSADHRSAHRSADSWSTAGRLTARRLTARRLAGWRLSLALLLAAGAPTASAMLALDDDSLAQVNGSDGIEIDVSNTASVASTEQKWYTDSGAAIIGSPTECSAGGIANKHACTILRNLTLSGVSPAPLHANWKYDVGTSATTGGDITAAMVLDWDPLWITANGLTLHTPTVDKSANSLGNLAVLADGYLKLSNRNGFFNSGGNFAALDFTSTGDMFIRAGGPGSPELSFSNFALINRFTTGAAGGHALGMGKIAFDSNGLEVSAPYTYSELTFNLAFKANPVNFDLTGRDEITLFGWKGGLKTPVFRVSPGGVAYGNWAVAGAAYNLLNPATSYTYQDHTGTNGGGARSEGLNLLASWDFDTDFTWIIGQASGNETQVLFTNWRRLGAASTAPVLYMPVTFDVMQNGVGPAGLCLGGGFRTGVPVQASCTTAGGTWLPAGVSVGKAAFAIHLRDAHVWGYNQTVEVRDPTQGPTTQYNWSLGYTFGKLDGDIYLYPEGRGTGLVPSTTATGVKLDATVVVQSPGFWEKANSTVLATRQAAASNWDTNTNFFLADTNVGGGGTQFGFGLLNADLTWTARDLYLRAITGDAGYPDMPAGIWLQTDVGQRYFMRGLFGGGTLTNMSQPTAMALVSLDLSTNRFIFVMSPHAPVNNEPSIGFDGLLDLDGTSSLTLAEVSAPTAAFRLYDVSGRVGWKEGSIAVQSGQNTASGRPQLTISNKLLFGRGADFGSGGGAELIGKVGFGTENYGRIFFTEGNWRSQFSLIVPPT